MKPFSRLQRQYLYLADNLQSLVQDGSWDRMSKSHQNRLTQKLHRLAARLRGQFSRRSLVRALGAAAFLMGSWATLPAQNFAAPVATPFGITSVNNYGPRPTFADLDNDGDVDLLVTDYQGNFYYFQNTGSATAPAFGIAQTNPFGLQKPIQYTYVLSTDFADIDNDGDMDLIAGEYYGDFYFYQNTGTATAPVFGTPTLNPFSLANIGTNHSSPRFGDLDGDSDLDIMSGSYTGGLYYFQNTGSVASPAFGGPTANPFGVSPPVAFLSIADFTDLDNDGDLDMVTGNGSGNIVYFANTGTAASPSFGLGQTNPFNLVNVGAYSAPVFVDIDGDGDQDLFVCEEYGATVYFENTGTGGCVNTTSSITEDACDTYTAPSGAIFTSSGTIVDTIPNAGGCDSLITINLTVSTIDSSVSNTGNGTLIATAAGVSYQWIDCNGGGAIAGETNQFYTPTATGDYAVVLTDGICTDTSACTNVVVVGIDDGRLADVELYPNPGQDHFAVDLGHRMDDVDIAVYDLQGREIYRAHFDAGRVIPVQLRPAAGIYTVKITSPEGHANLKWIVE